MGLSAHNEQMETETICNSSKGKRELGINLTEQGLGLYVEKPENIDGRNQRQAASCRDILCSRIPKYSFVDRQADSKIYTESQKKSRQNNLERIKLEESHQLILGIPLQFRLVELGGCF